MFRKYWYKIIIGSIFFGSALLYSHSAFAATINITPSSRVGVYDVFLSVLKNESINAIDGSIIFDESSTVVPTIEKNDSIIPLWAREPSVSGNSVNFSGIIPGGFSVVYDQFGGEPKTEGKIFSIIFPFAKGVNFYNFTIDSVSVYENDGRGVATMISPKSITLPVSADLSDFRVNTDVVPRILPGSTTSKLIFLAFLMLFIIAFLHFLRNIRKKLKKVIKN